VDKYEREYVGLNLQISPGYNRFVQSADPAIQAQLKEARKGEVVWVTGVVKNRGSNIRILTIKTLVQAATPGPVAVAQPVTETVAA
jgi:hypothetical protein